MNKIALMVCASLASGCSTFPMLKQSPRSTITPYVAPEIGVSESEEIAKDMAVFLATQLPPAKTTLEINPSATSFHDILFTELVWRGFGVVENPEEEAVKFSYFVTPLDSGIVVRMKYGQHVAGRFYNRNAGKLFANAYVVRGVSQ